MSAPALQVQINGNSTLSGDNCNTYQQTCDTAAQLRGFIGVPGVQVYMRGQSAPADGYQGVFYWNVSGNAADDNGVTTVVPNGSGTGEWSRIVNTSANAYTYLVPTTGTSITIGTGITALVLNPAGTLASLTITMPLTPLDGSVLTLASTKTITTLSLSAASGQTLLNAPATLTGNTSVSFMYVLGITTWVRLL